MFSKCNLVFCKCKYLVSVSKCFVIVFLHAFFCNSAYRVTITDQNNADKKLASFIISSAGFHKNWTSGTAAPFAQLVR